MAFDIAAFNDLVSIAEVVDFVDEQARDEAGGAADP